MVGIALLVSMASAAAPPAPPYLSVPRPPWPRIMIHQLLTSDDYPAAALRNEEQGTTQFRLAVGKDGRVGACTVTSSSGSSSLDSATCRLMMRRAVFDPARDRRGRPRAGRYEGRIAWRIREPEERAPPVP
ncbi:MAG TPA: TonB family protein [Allosphingosinicella sp.]|jgi:protein TonB|nr:TonB family protein [Allosphingosinicella sp.]